ncbi:MAG: hypothetical protein U9R60_02085 [Bacteroidota bacterium]|nr:hypothetical protein [Bacteroidota bacterium]
MPKYYTGVWALKGKKFKVNAVHIWTVKYGMIVHFFEAADTAEIII